jgi:arginyl-tRNA synthetase
VQYAHVRCASVLRRVPENAAAPEWTALDNREAVAVLKLIEAFPGTLTAAAEKNEPFYVTRNVKELAQAFNKYYFAHKIIDEDKSATAARLALTKAVRDILKRGLALLGIKAPETM